MSKKSTSFSIQMYLYEFIFVTLFIYATEAKGVDENNKYDEGINIIIILNNTSPDDYNVEVVPGDCQVIEESGRVITAPEACKSVIHAGQTKAIKLKAAIQGFSTTDDQCWIYIKFNSYDNNRKEMVKIMFHVSLLEGDKKTEIISMNCDNFNGQTINGSEVECNKIATDNRKYINKAIKNCETVSSVEPNIQKGAVISDSLTAHALVKRDTKEIIKVTSGDHKKEKVLRETAISNSTEPFGLTSTKDVCPQTTEKHVKMKHEKIIHEKSLTLDQSVYKYLKQYRWITALLVAITIIQCILIFTICMRRKCQCFGEKRVISHFFSTYQQDSVTTPLISTSAMDIDKLKSQFISESSTNTANQKCYKSCGKDKSENTKISMSDDILSKFINRRDWKNNYKSTIENETNDEQESTQIAKVHSKHKSDNENISKHDDLQEKKYRDVSEEIDNENNKKDSDREGKYHSFSCYNTQVDSASTFENKIDHLTTESKVSSEKAAQTYFSKDSIDLILAERNIYLADENLSKYTLSSESGKNKSTELLNKASRNIVKYFNTLLHRSRHGSQSDPGKEKDLKLLHMSQTSLYSTNDSE